MTGILAHRGYSKKYPENTMLAFKEAAKFDIDGFETDVQMTKDGILVFTHDEEISRVSNGEGLIKDLTLDELKALDFRCGMTSYELNEDTRIPTMEEFMVRFVETDFIINLELKTSMIRYPQICEKVIEVIKKYDVADRIIISSFNHRDVVKFKRLMPEVKCGFLTYSVFYDPAIYTKIHDIDYYHPDFNAMDDIDWKQCREVGIETIPYTIDDPSDMRHMCEEGVKYIITNDPLTAVEIINEQ